MLFRDRPKLRRLSLGVIIGAAAAAVASTLFLVGAFTTLEYKALDARFQLFPFNPPSKDIVVFVIDEKSLLNMELAPGDKHGWPWTREVYGKMITYANLCGAKAVVLDLDFSSSFNPQKDEDFGQYILANASMPVYTVVEFKDETEQEFLDKLAFRKAFLKDKEIATEGGLDFQNFNSVYPPVKPIAQPVRRIGASNFYNDSDGVARRTTLLYGFDGKVYPSLPLAVAIDAKGGGVIKTQFGGRMLVLEGPGSDAKMAIPLEAGSDCLIKWYDWLRKPKDYYTIFPLYYCGRKIDERAMKAWQKDKTLHAGSVDLSDMETDPLAVKPELLKGKIVFIGAQASSLADNKSTPMDSIMPGVCVHATALQNILSGDFITHNRAWLTIALVWALCLLTGVTCTALVPAFHRLWVAAVVLFALVFVYLAGYSGVAAYEFARHSLWLDVVAVWAGILGTYAVSTTVGYMTESKGKREFKKAFSKYLSAELVEELSKDFASITLNKGTRQDLTVLFSDIRNFTPMSEKMKPEEVVMLLNEYLSAMVEVIFRNGGFLDKYLGDGIMAIFTAPKRDGRHAQFAVRAACEMVETIDRMKEQWAREGKQVFDIGIGLNSGEMVVGNIGWKSEWTTRR